MKSLIVAALMSVDPLAASAQVPAPEAAPATPPVPQPVTDSPPAGADARAVKRRAAEESITVTGSRIRRKDLTTAAPVTVVSREQIAASGKISIGDFLQSLPEQGNAINTQVNNGGSGATRVNLRGLGTERTLVLLNGRRFVPGGSGADSSVDLNSIPTAAIERVEVLKDGASAVYGSDAIAGVVNIITRRKLNGAELGAYAGTSSRGDGTIYDVSATTGSSGDQGNAVFSIGYNKIKPIFAGDRDFSRIPRGFDAVSGEYTSGSGTVPQGTFTLPRCNKDPTKNKGCIGQLLPNPNNDPRIAAYNALIGANKTTQTFIRDDATGTYRPFRGVALSPDGDGYNFQPENYLVTPQQRISLYATGDHKLGDSARAFFESSYVNRQSDVKLAPEPLGTSGEGVVVSANNLYNPFGRDFTAVSRRLVEFGNRSTFRDIDTFRVAGGFDGTLSDSFGPLRGWFWEVLGNYGRTQGDTVKRGNLKRAQLANALGPSMLINGKPACVQKAGDPTTAIAGCVPLNLFGGAGSISDDQISGLTFTGTLRGINQLAGVQANASGDLFRLYGDKPLSLAVGYEYRQLLGANIPDPVTVAGDTTGNKGLITQGSFYINEGYGELSIPVLANLPLAETIEASVAGRVFNYSNFGSDFTYKLGARWKLVGDFTVRGTYSTAFRAPGIADLYLGLSDSFPNAKDPCAGPNAPATCGTTSAKNETGAALNNGDPSLQLRSQIGGNAGLKPETAKVFTLGGVIEPSAVKNLSVTVDYYNIAVDQSISSFGTSFILNSCYLGTAAQQTQFCPLITRDPLTQRVSNVVDLNVNVGQDKTSGIDVAVRYAVPSGYGRFGFLFDGTWLQRFDRVLADGTVIHGKGTFDIGTTGGVYPEWKFNAGITWSLGGFGAGVLSRFLSAFRECGTAGGDFSGRGKCYVDSTYSRRVSPYNAYDLYLSYALASDAGKTTIAAGVLNAFDRKPSVIYNGFTAASDPTAYDFVGRYPYARLSHAF